MILTYLLPLSFIVLKYTPVRVMAFTLANTFRLSQFIPKEMKINAPVKASSVTRLVRKA